ncbi:MAG TPA: Uma2 family endonuclease [Saprospiraceae bacterium]|mgnify:CR=1 FL=1|nr:Uma2 family endonuclease [Saprospiraceae bacterium]
MPIKQLAENTAPQKLLLTVYDYHRMGAAGVFEKKSRVELINGEIYTMSPLSPSHNAHVDKISRFFHRALYDKALVRTQGSVQIDEYTEPEPDIVILQQCEDYYSSSQPSIADIHLVIEVAVNSLQTDRGIKKKQYARAAVPEYWIVIPQRRLIEVYKKPTEGEYQEKNTYHINDEWLFMPFHLRVKGQDLLL